MAETTDPDGRRRGPADIVTTGVTPELLVCTAVLRCGLADGAGASVVLGPTDRIGLAATDETFVEVAEMQFSNWEGPGPEVVQHGRPVVVEDLHAHGARWPLTTPHATTTRVRALATYPLLTGHGTIGLFAAYRTEPVPFSDIEVEHLRTVAAALGALVCTRFDDAKVALHLPSPALAVAVGMAAFHLGIAPDDALAVLRAKAFASSVTVSSLASDLVAGSVSVEDLLDPLG